MTLTTLALVGGLVALASHGVWVWGIWKGTMHLNVATWSLWAVIDTAVLLTSIAGGASAPFLSVGFVVGAILVSIVLLFKGTWRWGVLETICASTGLVCLFLWYLAGPIVALICLTVGKYGIAGMPTLVGAYVHPERAQSWNWFVGAFAATTNIFAAGSWTLAQSFFPTVVLFFCAVVGIMHLRQSSRSTTQAIG